MATYRIVRFGTHVIAEKRFKSKDDARRWLDDIVTGQWLDGCELVTVTPVVRTPEQKADIAMRRWLGH